MIHIMYLKNTTFLNILAYIIYSLLLLYYCAILFILICVRCGWYSYCYIIVYCFPTLRLPLPSSPPFLLLFLSPHPSPLFSNARARDCTPAYPVDRTYAKCMQNSVLKRNSACFRIFWQHQVESLRNLMNLEFTP